MATTLSDLLDAIRLRNTNWLQLELGVDESVLIRFEKEAALYILLAGAARLSAPNEQCNLEVGSGAFVLRGGDLCASAGNQSRPIHQVDFAASRRPDIPPLIRVGMRRRLGARMIVGKFAIDVGPGNPILSMVSNVLPLMVSTPQSTAFDPFRFYEYIGRPGAMAYLGRAAEVFLIRALQCSTYRSVEEHKCISSSLGSGRILRAIKLITENPAASWSVEGLAREVSMSRSSFAAEFARIVGKSPMRMVQEQRLEAAANVLARGASSVGTVAHCVGYQSEATFSRIFKERYGLSPGAYHRRCVSGQMATDEGNPRMHCKPSPHVWE